MFDVRLPSIERIPVKIINAISIQTKALFFKSLPILDVSTVSHMQLTISKIVDTITNGIKNKTHKLLIKEAINIAMGCKTDAVAILPEIDK